MQNWLKAVASVGKLKKCFKKLSHLADCRFRCSADSIEYVGSAKTVKKGIPELKTAGLIADTASVEPTLTDKGHKTSV